MQYPLHPTQDLCGDWTLALSPTVPDVTPSRPADLDAAGLDTLPARVPGNFELDLLAAGRIEEPFVGMNIAGLQPFEGHHVWYARTFEAHRLPGHEAALRFEGLDCVADVFLNGHLVGSADNALISHEFDVDGELRDGANELLVHLSPALEAAARYDYPPSAAAMAANYESLYIRKAPSSYGWDIMPRALSGGLWRPVTLVQRPAEHLDTLFLRTLSADAGHASLLLHYTFTRADLAARYEIEIVGEGESGRFEHRTRALFSAGRLGFGVDQPALWWPKGRGDQHLYRVSVRLLRDGEEIDRAEFRHGIRTVALDRTSITDQQGSGEFCFRVNGERLFVLGTNWVPADAYHSRDAARLPRMLELLDEVGCNLVRCWGGNVYENDAFYDRCDELGVLVWQDFALACAVYPQDDDFATRVAVEARAVVRRLREHACLALWAGDNECDQAYDWNALGNPNRNRLTREVLPGVLAVEDPGRTYLPSSPYIDEVAYAAGARLTTEDHLWGPRDAFKSDYYRGALCHFASEMGYHGCPAPESVRRFISPDKLWPPDNEEWLLHATSPVPGVNLYDYRIALMQTQIRSYFGVDAPDLETFAELSQWVQAEAFKFFVESFRGAKWRRTGIVWWNLIDGWPQFSDAVVDYYFTPKRAFHTLKIVQQPLLVMMREPADGGRDVVACNDTREDLELTWRVCDVDSGAEVLAGKTVAAGDAVTVLGRILVTAEARCYRCEWRAKGVEGRNHYVAAETPVDVGRFRGWMVGMER
jgi:beta-mannosidase